MIFRTNGLRFNPSIDSFPIGFVFGEVTLIPIAITVAFYSFAMSVITGPVPFIESTFPIQHHSPSNPFPIYELTPVDGIFKHLDAEVLALFEFIEIKNITSITYSSTSACCSHPSSSMGVSLASIKFTFYWFSFRVRIVSASIALLLPKPPDTYCILPVSSSCKIFS
jgi:hypothetical protein